MTERIVTILEELRALLRAEAYGDADYVEQTRLGFLESTELGCSMLGRWEFWGGAGSLVDTYFCRENLKCMRPGSHDQSEIERLIDRDDNAFASANRKLLLLTTALSDEFKRVCTGEQCRPWVERSQSTADGFRNWVARGLQ